jgi:beta-N-acetylhexosaminidase
MGELRRQLGSLILCGFEGTSLPTELQTLLSQNSLGGIILFARNYDNSAKLKKLTTATQTAALGSALIAVDQEGGRVVRFAGDFPVFPSPRYFGDRNDLDGLLQSVRATGVALRDHGVNVNLVPVCDLDPGDESHVLHLRAYASDPEVVAYSVGRQVQVLKEVGIIACAKHFPGLGSSRGDPHFQVAESSQSIEQFRDRDYLPFRSAIASGVAMVMPTHLRARALDPQQIVTFSRIVIEGELRSILAFEGLVISDDLQMLGALEGIDQIEAGRRALLAGCNLLIYANLQDSLETHLDAFTKLAEADEELRARVGESYQRLVAFRNSNPQYFVA